MAKRKLKEEKTSTSSRSSSKSSSSRFNAKDSKQQQQGNGNLNIKQRKKYCYFCKENIDTIDYKDVSMLRKFVSDKGKIRPKRSTGNCVQHQRKIAHAIKRAREMALIPYFLR